MNLLVHITVIICLVCLSYCQPFCNNSWDKIANYNFKSMKLGVEISGIDLKQHVTNRLLFEKIVRDAHRHRLIVFRNQGEVAADLLLSISQHFGSLYMEPFTTQTKTVNNHHKSPSPAIMRISNDVAEGFKGVGTSGWHIDGAYKPVPYSFLIFNAVNVPSNGDTKFTGFREVLGSLDKSTFEKWNKLWSINGRKVLGENVFETHPLIYNHPVVNETVMCIHLGYIRGAVENYETSTERFFTETETDQLRQEITAEIEKDQERLIYSHKWQEGDLIIIDNLQVAHLASKESQMSVDQVGLRVLHRVAVNGIRSPTKV